MSASNDSSNLRALARVAGLLALIVVGSPPVIVLWALKLDRWRGLAVRRFYAVAAWLVGLRFTVDGRLSDIRPLMLVSNHTSYLDVLVLGGLVPLSFIPKKEVGSWPVIGFFCVLADSVFVERKPSEMHKARAEMERRLQKGKVLCLFPEGTTSNGKEMKPFKSGFFSLAEQYALPIQPLVLAYTHIGRETLTAARREEVAWIGEASFFGHFFHVLALPYVRVRVQVHPLQHLRDFPDRKALARSCEETIRTGLSAILEQEHGG